MPQTKKASRGSTQDAAKQHGEETAPARTDESTDRMLEAFISRNWTLTAFSSEFLAD